MFHSLIKTPTGSSRRRKEADHSRGVLEPASPVGGNHGRQISKLASRLALGAVPRNPTPFPLP